MRRKFSGVILTSMTAVFFSAAAFADPIVVTPTGDATTLANTLLAASSGITNVTATYTGASSASGTFSGGSGVIGIESGILLTSGAATGVIGPNTVGNSTADNDTSGDADLSLIVGDDTLDASSLLINFTPAGDQISFAYVFGSEEYNEYVNSSFNDVFAFFVNGANFALIPGTSTPVSINTVNNGAASAFFVDNAAIPGPFNTQLDGFTTVLTFLAPVNAGVQNTLKLAIADTSDAVLDSAVFLKGGSLQVGPPPVDGVIPEPASLMLVGTGLAALYRRHRNSRKRT